MRALYISPFTLTPTKVFEYPTTNHVAEYILAQGMRPARVRSPIEAPPFNSFSTPVRVTIWLVSLLMHLVPPDEGHAVTTTRRCAEDRVGPGTNLPAATIAFNLTLALTPPSDSVT